MMRMLNDVADSIGVPGLVTGDFRKDRAKGFVTVASRADSHGTIIEIAAITLLIQLGNVRPL